MHSLEILERMNGLACCPRVNHSRLHALVWTVQRLPVGGIYRANLLRSIDRYGDQIISRPCYKPEDGWDDLEALQQVTLADMMEATLQHLFRRCE